MGKDGESVLSNHFVQVFSYTNLHWKSYTQTEILTKFHWSTMQRFTVIGPTCGTRQVLGQDSCGLNTDGKT